MSFLKTTKEYEEWLADQMPVVDADVKLKHEEMATEIFPFFRATFYRWVHLWKNHCQELDKAPKVLSVGDLHVENFGTWRDIEGRLVWGINDFDEAFPMPFTVDLVRLATSAVIAIEFTESLTASKERAYESILAGYSETIANANNKGISSVEPIILAEENPWLLSIAQNVMKDPEKFWKKLLAASPATSEAVPEFVNTNIASMMPEEIGPIKWTARQAGLGSLGRPRLTAVTKWQGGYIAREAKRICTSAYAWGNSILDGSRIYYKDILDCAVRCRDPFMQQKSDWIFRRLAPDCLKIRLTSMPREHEYEFLKAMGRETANIHLGTPERVQEIENYLKSLDGDWLHKSALKMRDHTLADFEEWRQHYGSQPK